MRYSINDYVWQWCIESKWGSYTVLLKLETQRRARSVGTSSLPGRIGAGRPASSMDPAYITSFALRKVLVRVRKSNCLLCCSRFFESNSSVHIDSSTYWWIVHYAWSDKMYQDTSTPRTYVHHIMWSYDTRLRCTNAQITKWSAGTKRRKTQQNPFRCETAPIPPPCY